MKKLIYFGLILSLLSSPPLMAQGQKHSTYYEQRASHFRSLVSKKKCIVFLGDSLSDGAEWSELFSRQDILNRGISGDTSTGVLDRLDEVVRHQPKKIFLLIGINDIARDISPEQNMPQHLLYPQTHQERLASNASICAESIARE